MGKGIIFLLLAAAGFGVYWTNFHKSPAYLAYLQWTQATLAGNCNDLNSLAAPDSAAKKWVDNFCGATGSMTVMGSVIPAASPAGMVADLHNTPMGSSIRLLHEIQSEEEAADGTVSLTVIETVGNPPTAHFKPAPPRRHDVKLKEINGAWKLLDFQEKDQ
jgi:hypothetical protein